MNPRLARAIIEKLYRNADAGDAAMFEDFSPDARIYFPKFGIGSGEDAWREFADGLFASVAEMAHDIAGFDYVVSGDTVVVEGTTSGRLVDGRRWAGGETPGGRFVSIFVFDAGKIARMHIYTDPDYAGDDSARFLWGEPATRTW